MKTLLTFAISLLFTANALAQKITASITVTNATVNGYTFTVNGSVRTWTNQVFQSGTQVATNADVTGSGSKTNLFNQIALNPFALANIFDTGSNSFNVIGTSTNPVVVTLSGAYASVSYSTQTVANGVSVVVPMSALPSPTTRSNLASQLEQDLLDYSTNSKIVDLSKTQTVTGPKDFSNTNSTWRAPVVGSPSISGNINTVSNGTWYGGAIIGGSISGLPTIVLSNNTPSETSSFFTHIDNSGPDAFVIGHGGREFFLGIIDTNTSEIAGPEQKSYVDFNLGGESEYNITSVGGTNDSESAHRFYVTRTNGVSNKLMDISGLGVWGVLFYGNGGGLTNLNAGALTNSVPNAALTNRTVTDLTFKGTNNFPANSDLAFTRNAISSLANGVNAAVPVGTNVFIEVSGPSGAFSINGIANGRDGKLVVIVNQTGFDMTIAHQSGSDSTAANRIISMTGADRTTTGNGVATLIYSGAASRWLLISFDP